MITDSVLNDFGRIDVAYTAEEGLLRVEQSLRLHKCFEPRERASASRASDING